MKKILLFLLLSFPVIAYSQTTEEQYYLYNIVSFEGDFTTEDFKVFYDDGIEVKRLRKPCSKEEFDKAVQKAIAK